MTPTVRIHEDSIDVEAPSLTWNEARELASCSLKWKACQRDYTRREAETADRRRRTLWTWVLAVCAVVLFLGAAYMAAVESKLGAGLIVMAVLSLWAIYAVVSLRRGGSSFE